MASQTSQKQQSVNLAIDQIQKQFGKGAIMRLGERGGENVDVIPTGILPLDIALGVGGLPKGRIAEVFGPEASGKTTLALNCIAQAQKGGGVAAFIDVEHALDPSWARTLGVKIDDLLISQPDTGEQALEIAETLIRSGGIDIVVIDSVAALVPRVEIEGEMGDAQIGVQARLMSQALRKLTSVVSKSNTIVVFTNQIRLKIGIMFGNPETTPGGMALKFYTSIRIDIRKIESIKKGDQVVGSRHRAKIVKNKMASPFQQAVFVVDKDGVDKEEALITTAIQLDILSRSGSFIKLGDNVIGQGVAQVKESLQSNPKLNSQITNQVYAKAFPKKHSDNEHKRAK